MTKEVVTRRSTRSNKRKRYTNDAFDGVEGIESLLDQSFEHGISLQHHESAGEEDESDAHTLDQSSSSAEESTGDIGDSQVVIQEEERDGAVSAPVIGLEDDIVIVGDNSADVSDLQRRGKSARIPKDRPQIQARAQDVYTRGFIESLGNNAKEERVLTMTGSGEEDLIAYARTRDRWMNAKTVPPRHLLKQAAMESDISPYHVHERVRKEVEFDWIWYRKQRGLEAFCNYQQVENIVLQENPQDWPYNSAIHDLLIGSIHQPHHHALSGGESIALQENPNDPDCSLIPSRQGWIINFGSWVQCLEWVPNREDTSQYLTVSSGRDIDDIGPPDEQQTGHHDLSAFCPLPPRPSFLYIFQVTALPDEHCATRLNLNSPPRLRATLSFQWNRLKTFKWCPVSSHDQKRNLVDGHLGLLAGVWLDGFVRILDVSIPVATGEEPTVLHFHTAAFQSCPPNTVCTSVTWLSASSIAVGCANGSLAIWKISDGLGQNNPRPWFYRNIHNSYILNVVSGYPSRPSYLFASCVDGWTRMLDVRDYKADSIYSPRHRLMSSTLAWQDSCQLSFHADDSGNLEANFLRFFYSTFYANRFSGCILDIATSVLHPYVVVGTTDGIFACLNMMAKLRAIKKAANLRQIVFQYEWRGPISDIGSKNATKSSSQSEAGNMTAFEQAMLSKPLGRFTEGFKADTVSLDNSDSSYVKTNGTNATIHEERTAVNKVAWNPNTICATWTAAATGSGLVRIEDLGID